MLPPPSGLRRLAPGSFETLVRIDQTTRRHISKDCNFHFYCRESLKCNKITAAIGTEETFKVKSPRFSLPIGGFVELASIVNDILTNKFYVVKYLSHHFYFTRVSYGTMRPNLAFCHG
jgi:hypothetical protein